MTKKQKGFTLIELVATVVILGLIIIVTYPRISRLAEENKTTKFEKYEEALIAASKLYTDSYDRDMFGNNLVGCIDIKLQELIAKGLISDIKTEDTTCISDNTFVNVTKNKNNYKYKVSILCKQNNKVIYDKTTAPGLHCQGGEDSIGPAIDIELTSPLQAKVDNSSWTIGNKSDENVIIKLSDNSGILENAEIEYAWSKATTPENVTESYTIYNYENERYKGTPDNPLEYKLSVPTNITGDYYLYVRSRYIADSLGNEYSDGIKHTKRIKIDNTPPTCQNNQSKIEWIGISTEKNIEMGCIDNHSSCTKTKYTKKVTASLASSPIEITIKDKVGNETKCPLNVQIDTEAPSCAVSSNQSNWTNTSVKLTGTCTDTKSGCTKEKTEKTFSSEMNTKKSPGEVCDNAGNCIACPKVSVKIDKTAPTCTVSGGNTNWTNGSRTITASCSDTGGSSCKTTSFSKTYSSAINTTKAGAKGNNSGGTVEDYAGNKTNCAANQTVRIDKTAPTCTVSGGNTNWTKGSRIITASCSDSGGSGCKTSPFSKTYSSTINTTKAGAKGNNSGGTVEDYAGNKTNCAANQTVRIDKTAPTTPQLKYTKGSFSGSSYTQNTWSNQNIYRQIKASDADSKISHFEYKNATSATSNCSGAATGTEILTNAGGGISNNTYYQISYAPTTSNYACFRTVDKAGNVSAWSPVQKLKIDKNSPTNPTINMSSNGETANNVTFTITSGSDSGSGGVTTEYKIDGGSWTRYTGRVTLLTNTGYKTVTARSKDAAGNYSGQVTKAGYCDKDAVTVSRKDNNSNGFRLNLKLTYSPSGVTSNKYQYAYWLIQSTSDTKNNQSGQVSSICGASPPAGTTIHTTTSGYTGYIPQKYTKEYYCFAVRPYRSTEISQLNRWTVQRKHAMVSS